MNTPSAQRSSQRSALCGARGHLLTPKLAAGGILVKPAAGPEADGDTTSFKNATKCLDPLRRRPFELLLLNRVVGDEVHMTLEATNAIRQLCGVVGLVVEFTEKDVFETHPATGHIQIVTAIIKQGFIGVGMGCGDELLAQPLVGRMETYSKGELSSPQPLHGQFRKLRQGLWNTNSADGDTPLADAEIIIETANRLQNSLTVQKRLTHTHKDDVGRTSFHRLTHTQHLIHDFVGPERTL
jgi:hypothetical protein